MKYAIRTITTIASVSRSILRSKLASEVVVLSLLTLPLLVFGGPPKKKALKGLHFAEVKALP